MPHSIKISVPPETVSVILTKEDAALFALFQKHYATISFLISQEAFDVRQGSVTVHFDNDGNLSSIEKKVYRYPKKSVV